MGVDELVFIPGLQVSPRACIAEPLKADTDTDSSIVTDMSVLMGC